MKKIITAILLAIKLFAFGQEHVSTQIDQFNISILNMLKKEYNNKLQGYKLDDYDIKIIPSLYYSFNDSLTEHFELDTTRWELIGISKSLKDTIVFHRSRNIISRTTWLDRFPYQFKIFNRSKYCFYIYFNKKEPYFSYLMGYMINGKIENHDHLSIQYKNLDDAAIYYYGSIEYLMDVEKIEKSKDDFLRKTSFEGAKNFLKNSYTICYSLFPSDTLLLLDTYLNEVETKIHLFVGQKNFLKRLIQQHIKDCTIDKNPEYDYFMNIFVSFDLMRTLTHEQYYDYKKNSFYFNQKVKLSKDILYNFYIKQPNNQSEHFEEFLKKEVFNKLN